jgi:ketosteroid isomerase-like protein
MKLVTGTVFACVLMAGVAVAQQSAMASKAEMRTGPANVEQHLMAMENEWARASLRSDGNAIEPMLSPDFVNINSDGTVLDRARTVARTNNSKMEISELSELAVNTHGDTAVVTGVWTGKGVNNEGKAFEGKERWADTWMKKNGKWQCVASASAPIKSEQ